MKVMKNNPALPEKNKLDTRERNRHNMGRGRNAGFPAPPPRTDPGVETWGTSHKSVNNSTWETWEED